MKKIILTSLALTLAACGGSGGGSSDDSNSLVTGVNLQVN
jgi:ABC-type glycerol-3-phosphate transport system substrate-binding protein